MKREWVSIVGPFEYEKGKFVFKGRVVKTEAQEFTEYGVFISNEKFYGGSIQIEAEFEDVTEYSSCEIVLYRDPQSGNLITAGLHSAGSMYQIRKFTEKWEQITGSGTGINLKSKKKYKIEVFLDGSIVELRDQGVPVLSTVLPVTLRESFIGLWCFSRHDICVAEYNVRRESPKAFVVMQFGDPYDQYYSEIIKKICNQYGVEVKRADENYGSGMILSDIVQDINSSKLIIADISTNNPNVYYEVGYAHALNKPTILLAERDTKLPFDISPFRVLFYENSISGKTKFEEGFIKHLTSLVSV